MYQYEIQKRISELMEMEQKVMAERKQLEAEKESFKQYKNSVESLVANVKKTLEGYAVLDRTVNVIYNVRNEFNRDYNTYQSCTILLDLLNKLSTDKRYETKCLVNEITEASKDRGLQLLNAGMDRVKLTEMMFCDILTADSRRANSSEDGNHPSRRYPSM